MVDVLTKYYLREQSIAHNSQMPEFVMDLFRMSNFPIYRPAPAIVGIL